MRILILAHRIPYPPHTGDKVRAYHVARHLARDHDVTLGFLVDDGEDWRGLTALGLEVGQLESARVWRPWGLAKGLLGLATGRTITVTYFSSAGLRRRLARRLRGQPFDLVYVSSAAMAQYVGGDSGAPVVMDFVDVDSDKWQQYGEAAWPPLSWLYRAEGARLRRYEAEVARWARLCVLATPVEEAMLRAAAPWAKTAVIPNGVDLEYFRRLPATANGHPTLIFTGAMDYRPNVDAASYLCDEIFPRVQRLVPGVTLLIVGANPSSRVRGLGRLPGVRVTGTVPDVRPYYDQASVCVAPLRIARGIQNKVLQGMAVGLPVVVTSKAAQGLQATPGEDLVVEDDPRNFAARVARLLESPAERQALGDRGRRFVETHHSWSACLGRLDGLLPGATRTGEGPGETRTPGR